MNNKVTIVIIAVFIFILVIVSIFGIPIKNFTVLSISQIINKNNELNEKIKTASNMTSVDYPDSEDTLDKTYDKFRLEKQKYEEIAGFTDRDLNDIYETKLYDIGYLWRTIGKYATTKNLKLGINVSKASGKNSYDLNFNVAGQYANIIQFISNIENNSDLNFRIYNFKMTGNGTEVSSTFFVKNVNIDPATTISKSSVATDSLNRTNTDNTDMNSNNNITGNNVTTGTNTTNNTTGNTINNSTIGG